LSIVGNAVGFSETLFNCWEVNRRSGIQL